MALIQHYWPICLLIGVSFALPQKPSLRDIVEGIEATCENEGHCVPANLCHKNHVITNGDGIFEERSIGCGNSKICCGNKQKPAVKLPPPTDTYKPCGNDRLCVPRFLCRNDEIVTNGALILTERTISSDDIATCEPLEICCGMPKEQSVPSANLTNKPDYNFNPAPAPAHTECGYRNANGIGSKSGNFLKSNEAQFGEFPWMVAILKDAYLCGGALIAPTVIVTAAHYVKNYEPNTLIVRAGEWDTQSKNDEEYPVQNRRIRQIITHAHYHRLALYNDIALLITESPFEYKDNVRPICLPPSNSNFERARCYATGWGKDKFGKEGKRQVILKKIDLPVVTKNQCQENLRKTRLGKFYELHESFICAGGEKDKDTCEGDGGSPLVCPMPGKSEQYYHAGIVAYGVGCGEENVPGVYVNVAHLRPWIDEKLSKL